MAKTSSARKAERSSARKRVYNLRRKRVLHDAIKALDKAVLIGSKEAVKQLPALQQALDKAAKHGTIPKNTAARMKSRMAKRVADLGKK